MNEQLKELRKSMISTELRDVKFENKNKEYVFNSIKSNHKKYRRVNNWIPRGLSMALISGFIFASFVFAKDYILKPNSSQIRHNAQSEMNTDNTEEQLKEVLTKEEAQLLMLNTVNYFKTAKGVFTHENDHIKETVEYQVSLNKGEIGSYIQTNLSIKNQDLNEDSSKKETNITAVFNGDKTLQLDNDSKKYHLSTAAFPFNKDDKIALNDAYKQMKEESHSMHPFGSAASSLHPYEWAEFFLKDHENWEIENQSSTFLDKNVMIIKGSLNKDNSWKFNASSFRFWVEKQTGILLKMELYNSDNEVVDSLITKELELNESVDKNKFSIAIPEGYTLEK
ncbi:sigma-E factor regulatory protein RseB domain-containing protein [Bacillus sp. 03113]|uniref:sigma-E factor regulatory protein RseB domain-containing protein n=1 Tax=Bacillus sp. 03113 TaxID=2578211 RepID=UPI0011440B48|nr:sigma-E factor regulatory protein RseB domain-containing protein [Bacillus sp. 03113]